MNKAQSTIEFTFAMIVILFLMYGMVRIFRWVGMDLAQRRVAQDVSLTNGWYSFPPTKRAAAIQSWASTVDNNGGDGVLAVEVAAERSDWQLNPDFYQVQSMDTVYNGTITNGALTQ